MSNIETEISFEVCRPIEAHAKQVMVWRNDPATLAMFFHKTPKNWRDFWLEYRDTYFNSGAVPGPIFAVVNGSRAGFLRFKRVNHPSGLTGSTVDISINLAPEWRAKGLGTAILKAVLEFLNDNDVDSVYAEILSDNIASIKAFTSAGFCNLGRSSKLIPDTGETHTIYCFLADLTSANWRRGRVFIIAEAGSNWRMGTPKRDMAMARSLIDVAIESGADAVKFQTYKPESVYVKNAGHSDYLSDAGIKDDIQDIFADLSMPYEMLPELADYCRRGKIEFMSTPFSPSDFAAIDPFVSTHKIASYEISHVHLLRLAAASQKPLVLSTGASNVEDVSWAVNTFRQAEGRDLCLLQCTAKYPAPISSLNLTTIPWLRRKFRVASGLSDHSREPAVAPVMAVALGAKVIEKHYTLDNRLPGPDHSFALLPQELSRMVREVRMAEQALGDGTKRVLSAEEELAAYARRGIQATREIRVGEILKEGDNFDVLRPGQRKLGLHPRYLSEIEGHKAAHAIAAGDGLRFDDVS